MLKTIKIYKLKKVTRSFNAQRDIGKLKRNNIVFVWSGYDGGIMGGDFHLILTILC